VQVLLRSIKFNWTFKKNFQPKAIIVGINISSIKLYIAYKKNPWLGVECLGFFEDRPMNRVLNKTQQVDLLHLGIINEAHHFIKNNKIDKIYIALPMSAQPRILQLLEELQDTTTSIYFIPDIYLFDLIQPNMTIIMGVPLVAICESPFDGNNGISKRIADILLSSLILMMILPLMVLIAFAVKLSSPGPIIFKQLRYGLDGKEIWIYKFRSMTVSQESELVVQAVQGDPRVTKIGNLLRKTSMDEFPQFFNVLRGNMSIVGPRPHAVSHNELYRRLIKGYMIRHKVKPGITGWAQINGFRGETDTLEKMQERIKFDLDYLRNWSLFLDLYIIVKTISVVIKDKNAY
jgi:putative colanic acid biosynthesis UDP-glucose lipid carrier transferase